MYSIEIFGKFFSKFWFSHLISNEEEMPTFEGHELLLKPIYCGVCGTDVDKVMNINQLLKRNQNLNRRIGKDYLGHEVVAEIFYMSIFSSLSWSYWSKTH